MQGGSLNHAAMLSMAPIKYMLYTFNCMYECMYVRMCVCVCVLIHVLVFVSIFLTRVCMYTCSSYV